MTNHSDIVIIIPAYDPDKKFISFLKDLTDAGYKNIIVTDDGSREDTKHLFVTAKEEFGCKILSHSINLGQGRAYKTAFNYFLSEAKKGGRFEHAAGIIQCDCDGQHHIEDIDRCADLLRANPGRFILGVRDFSDKSVPFRSRFGNNMTAFVFKTFAGMYVKDTQSGLRGVPRSLIPLLMETPGERFEYASSCLLETKKHKVEIIQFPIKTIYLDNNATSHFKPLRDSIRIYSLLLKYIMPSIALPVAGIAAAGIFLAGVRDKTDQG